MPITEFGDIVGSDPAYLTSNIASWNTLEATSDHGALAFFVWANGIDNGGSGRMKLSNVHKNHKLYMYLFVDYKAAPTPDSAVYCSLNLFLNARPLLSLPVQAAFINATAGPSFSPSYPCIGSYSATQQSSDAFTLYPWLHGCQNLPSPAEPAKVFIQPFEIDLVFNNLSLDFSTATSPPGTNIQYIHAWLGILSTGFIPLSSLGGGV